MSAVIQVGVGPLGYAAGTKAVAEVVGLTPEQRKKQFVDRGESVADWADKNGFARDVVYRVLNGRTPAWRGQPHQVAVKLGLKPDPTKTTA